MNSCLFCNHSQHEIVLQTRDFSFTGEQFQILLCTQCGIWKTHPIPEDLSAYYPSDYRSHKATSSMLGKLYQLAKRYTLRKKKNWIEQITNQQTGILLDYGAGNGDFLARFRPTWQCYGVEPSALARSLAATRHGLTLTPKLSNEVSPSVTTAWHVLEHLPDPLQTLQTLYQQSQENGYLIVATPNRNSCEVAHYGRHWAGYDVPRHLWHFTAENLGRIVEQAGWTITSQRRLPWDIFYISLLSEQYRKNPFAWLFATVKSLYWFRQHRSSWVVVAQKKAGTSG